MYENTIRLNVKKAGWHKCDCGNLRWNVTLEQWGGKKHKEEHSVQSVKYVHRASLSLSLMRHSYAGHFLCSWFSNSGCRWQNFHLWNEFQCMDRMIRSLHWEAQQAEQLWAVRTQRCFNFSFLQNWKCPVNFLTVTKRKQIYTLTHGHDFKCVTQYLLWNIWASKWHGVKYEYTGLCPNKQTQSLW